MNTETKFKPDSKFDGVMFPRHDSQPNGPQIPSMVLCKCGAMWKYHRFVDGACPTKKEKP